jgi:hypothetical protein
VIAQQNFNPERITSTLEKLGCKPFTSKQYKAESQPHSLWETPWGHVFMVPAGFCTDWELEQIIKRDFDGTRPKFTDDY